MPIWLVDVGFRARHCGALALFTATFELICISAIHVVAIDFCRIVPLLVTLRTIIYRASAFLIATRLSVRRYSACFVQAVYHGCIDLFDPPLSATHGIAPGHRLTAGVPIHIAALPGLTRIGSCCVSENEEFWAMVCDAFALLSTALV
jgi:hypothetical protein